MTTIDEQIPHIPLNANKPADESSAARPPPPPQPPPAPFAAAQHTPIIKTVIYFSKSN